MIKSLSWSRQADVQLSDVLLSVVCSLGLIYDLYALCCLANIYQMAISRQKACYYLFIGNMCRGTAD